MKTLFVSSTFKDMHYERDAIREIALPLINAEAKKYGQELSVCDLRWGINTLDLDSEEGSKKVLDVCLDQIDRCSPPMIVLFGDRYGHIPDSHLIASAAEAKRMELNDLNISVTALEVEYGWLSRRQRQSTLFYFRNMINAPQEYLCEDADHAQKLCELKKRITDIIGEDYSSYSVDYSKGIPDMTDFARTVADDVINVLLPEWQCAARLSEFELDRKIQWDFIYDRDSVFRGRDGIVSELIDRIEGGETRITVKGASGSGKSVVFSRLAVLLRERGYDVLPFVGGLTTESNDSLDVLRNTVVYLQNKLDGVPFDEIILRHKELNVNEWRAKASELINRYCDLGNKFIIMVDAVDQLFDDNYRKSNAFIPDCNNGNFVFFATCADEFTGLDIGSTRLKGLDVLERKSVVEGIMSKYGRELDKTVIRSMIALPAAKSPLYLGFLVKRLLMMNKSDYDEISKRGGQMNAISEHQRSIIDECPDTTEEMCALLLAEAGKRINEKLISRTIELLACSRFGLRESDLARLIGEEWNTLDFLHFVMYLGDCFILRDDGRYDFSHKSIRQGVLKNRDLKSLHNKIAEYFFGMRTDSVAGKEVLYHIICAENDKLFYEYTCAMMAEVLMSDDVNRINAYLMSAIEFYKNGGDRIAIALEHAPNDGNSYVLAQAIYAFLLAQINLGMHLDVAYNISEAFMKYAEKLKAENAECGEDAVRLARIVYGQACMYNKREDEYFDSVSANFEDCREAYEKNPNDDNLYLYIYAARQKLVVPEKAETSYIDRIYETFKMLLDISQERYYAEKNSKTVRNYYFGLNTWVVIGVVSEDYDLAKECLDESFDIAMDYVSEIDEKDVSAMIEISIATCGLLANKFQTSLFLLEQQQSESGDAEEEIFEAIEELGDATEDLYEFVIAFCSILTEAGKSIFKSFECLANLGLANYYLISMESDSAIERINRAKELLDEYERETGVTADTRALSYRIRSRELLLRANNAADDYTDLIIGAKNLLRDSENLDCSTYGGKTALVECADAVVGIYCRKLYADAERGKVSECDIEEAEALCDKMEIMIENNAALGEGAYAGLNSMRGLIEFIKSVMP